VDAAERAESLALIEEHGAMTTRLRAVVEMVEKRERDVAEADSLVSGGWLRDRARRKTRELLLDAETKLDREIEKAMANVPSGEKRERDADETEVSDFNGFQEWKGSLNATITPEKRYVKEAKRLLLDDDVERPSIPPVVWDLTESILRKLKFPQDGKYVQQASVAFLLFFAETWDDIDRQQVDVLVDQSFVAANEQRARLGQTPIPASDPKNRFLVTAFWWASDTSGTFEPLRSYIESQPAYRRLIPVKADLFGEEDDQWSALWDAGIGSAVSWMFVANEEPLADS
jgi:hypothetical protein